MLSIIFICTEDLCMSQEKTAHPKETVVNLEHSDADSKPSSKSVSETNSPAVSQDHKGKNSHSVQINNTDQYFF